MITAKDIKNIIILMCWSKSDLSYKLTSIVSTDVNLDNFTILEYQQNR